VLAFAVASPPQEHRISTGGGVLCRRSGETRFFTHTDSRLKPRSCLSPSCGSNLPHTNKRGASRLPNALQVEINYLPPAGGFTPTFITALSTTAYSSWSGSFFASFLIQFPAFTPASSLSGSVSPRFCALTADNSFTISKN